MKIVLRSLVLLLAALQLVTARSSPSELKFEKESVFIAVSVPEATRSPTKQEFETVGNIFIKEWDNLLKLVYAQDTEREYIRIEARVDFEKCHFGFDHATFGTWIRLYFKEVAIVFTGDSVPIPEKQPCYYPNINDEFKLLTGTPFRNGVTKVSCCIRPWTTHSDDTTIQATSNSTTIQLTSNSTITRATSNSGGGGGDPHFKTWSGVKYDFHGECDLVLLDNPSFADGLGMSIHIRTKRVRFFSEIATAAIRIGKDTLEFTNHEKWLLNGKRTTSKQNKISGYKIRRFHKAISVRLDDAAEKHAKIDFIQRNNGMLYVVVDGGSTDIFKGSLGMIGDWKTGQMVSRNGHVTIEEPSAFAREWQVQEELDGKIFLDDHAPQYPAYCLMPEKLNLRAKNKELREAAEKKCSSWGEDKDDCIFDVMATGDISVAEYPIKFSGAGVQRGNPTPNIADA